MLGVRCSQCSLLYPPSKRVILQSSQVGLMWHIYGADWDAVCRSIYMRLMPEQP